MVSNNPDFETKAADGIGLYLNPPTHAVVFCVDEKTAIQALDRKDRMLPLSPGRAENHGFEYKRNGTLSLFAAPNTATGEVLGKTALRHTSAQFVAFLTEVVSAHRATQEIHVICDNVSSYKTPAVQTFLLDHPNGTMHYTPTYPSWLNQVENWLLKFSATSSRAACSPAPKTSTKSSCAISVSATMQQASRTAEMEVRRPRAPHPVRFIRFNGLVRAQAPARRGAVPRKSAEAAGD